MPILRQSIAGTLWRVAIFLVVCGQLRGEVAHFVDTHRLGIERGGLGFECLDVAPAQFERGAGLLDGGAGPARVADGETRFGPADGGGLGVRADYTHGCQKEPKRR